MNAVRKWVWGPTLEEQRGECRRIINKNIRDLDKNVRDIETQQRKAKVQLNGLKKLPTNTAEQQRKVRNLAKPLAMELVKSNKHIARIRTSQAQLRSVQMQVNEAFSVRKIQGSMKVSTGIMKDVNTLVKLPALSKGMMELSQELMKAGIIEEMVSDMMPDDALEEDEEAEEEIDKVISDILKDKLPPSVSRPEQELPSAPVDVQWQEEEEDELDVAQMKARLEALKS